LFYGTIYAASSQRHDGKSDQQSLRAAKKLIEAAGGKLISMYGMPAEGPGVLAIFETSDPNAAAAISGVVVASGGLHNVKLLRLLTQDELVQVRQKASQLRSSFKPPGK